MAMLVHAAFHIIGRKGYEIIIDQNVEKAKAFARMIDEHPEFELITDPELNILNYRYVPPAVQQKLANANYEEQLEINEKLDRANKRMQKQQRASGKTFVSRTRFSQHKYHGMPVSVFRVVMANPMTTLETLQSILDEQCELAQRDRTRAILAEID
jgi:glutamate decarboxylase